MSTTEQHRTFEDVWHHLEKAFLGYELPYSVDGFTKVLIFYLNDIFKKNPIFRKEGNQVHSEDTTTYILTGKTWNMERGQIFKNEKLLYSTCSSSWSI